MSHDDLVAFLRARLDELEQAAHRRWVSNTNAPSHEVTWHGDSLEVAFDGGPTVIMTNDEYNNTFLTPDPDRQLLADVDSKRRIIDAAEAAYERRDKSPSRYLRASTFDNVVRLLALPYVEHPDYRQEWTP